MRTPATIAWIIRLLGMLSIVALLFLGRAQPVEAEIPALHGTAVTAFSTNITNAEAIHHEKDGLDARHANCPLCTTGHTTAAVLAHDAALKIGSGAEQWPHRDNPDVRSGALKRDPPVPKLPTP